MLENLIKFNSTKCKSSKSVEIQGLRYCVTLKIFLRTNIKIIPIFFKSLIYSLVVSRKFRFQNVQKKL